MTKCFCCFYLYDIGSLERPFYRLLSKEDKALFRSQTNGAGCLDLDENIEPGIFTLLYFLLFYCIKYCTLFYFILFFCILFCSIVFYSIPLYSILFHSTLLYYIIIYFNLLLFILSSLLSLPRVILLSFLFSLHLFLFIPFTLPPSQLFFI